MPVSIRNMSYFQVTEHTIRGQNIRERPGAVKAGHERDIRLAVKQYVPFDNPSPQEGDVTIIGAHANGFPKEVYEPLWDDIYERLCSQNKRIRAIWIADVAQQGKSGILNESILGDDPSWYDHARDMLFLINQFEIVQPVIGVGHSMGGTQLVHLSLMHPSLFEALILMDPVILLDNPGPRYALPSTYRRDLWASREQAAEKFLSSPFYQTWDPRVFQKWVNFGLRDLPTKLYPTPSNATPPAVTLTTTKAQEVFNFARPSYVDERSGLACGNPLKELHPDDIEDIPFYRPEPAYIFHRLPEVKPSVLYLFGENSYLTSTANRQEKVKITGAGVGGSGGASCGRVQEVVLPCGHLIPMERVHESAKASADFIGSITSCWKERKYKFQKAWEQVSLDMRVRIDKQWERNISALSKRSKL
ncbi:Alpha/beta hydrolase family-domain-containing protein [Penicillium concentricum]|uniref:Alpha/beta hydrolase family-domain-containing protein n=1 Tax=Penicillium concentricum TaxID=293559 RepID=A0A9W9S4F5_9EURO|nr:Alpha/beta hydrolase family-domain-containing protein [Penicillium concentricum]KAJ5371705.1 Alpha/beta hydrolase family-domain-containing protein [Penicillium concentricum]